ncbi:MAG: MucB/RseB C-terminal domain-containing protein [Pseudomonadota bacterium]|nr:MucB/RseB C-terminal domain-containing protein [Pseudomonadota bacterium]
MKLVFGSVLFLFLAPAFAFGANTVVQPKDGLGWLEKSALAAHNLNYQGIFVYQHGHYTETSRILHRIGQSGELERLESLDRTPRVIIRTSQNIRYYNLDQRIEMVEPLPSDNAFPAIFPEQMSRLSNYYNIALGPLSRYSGLPCQMVKLTPIDNLRYARHMCIGLGSGLLLHDSVLNSKHKPVENLTFTELAIGGNIKKSDIFEGLGGTWQIKKSSLNENMKGSVDFKLEPLPAGFHKVAEMMRDMPGRSQPVEHLIYTDGLTAVSLFIEPSGANPVFRIGLSCAGVIHVYTRIENGYTITALGEVPAVTVKKFARAVTLNSPEGNLH